MFQNVLMLNVYIFNLVVCARFGCLVSVCGFVDEVWTLVWVGMGAWCLPWCGEETVENWSCGINNMCSTFTC